MRYRNGLALEVKYDVMKSKARYFVNRAPHAVSLIEVRCKFIRYSRSDRCCVCLEAFKIILLIVMKGSLSMAMAMSIETTDQQGY